MSVIFGLAAILSALAAGEAAAGFFGLPVPGSVIGMILLTVLLRTKLVPLGRVEKTADFLTGQLSFFFVPAGVGIMSRFDLVRNSWPAVLVSVTAGTALTACLVGLFHSAAAGRRKKT